MRIASPADIIDFDPYSTRTVDPGTHQFGSPVELADGRKFRFGKAGGSNISRGKLQHAPSPKGNHSDVAVAANADVGAESISVTLGATAAVAGEYDEGFAVVIDGAGEGQVLGISHNPAHAGSGAITIVLADYVKTALASASSKVDLVHNSYNGVQETTTNTLVAAGVPLVGVTAGDYVWLQTRGIASVLADETLTLGAAVTGGTSTAGSVEEWDDVTAPITENLVGFVNHVAGTDTEYPVVVLCID